MKAIDERVARRIVELRQQGVSVRNIGQRLGVGKQTILRYSKSLGFHCNCAGRHSSGAPGDDTVRVDDST